MGGWAGSRYLAARAEEVPGSALRWGQVWQPGLSWLVSNLQEKGKKTARHVIYTHAVEAGRCWDQSVGARQCLLDLNAVPQHSQLFQTLFSSLREVSLSNTQTLWASDSSSMAGEEHRFCAIASTMYDLVQVTPALWASVSSSVKWGEQNPPHSTWWRCNDMTHPKSSEQCAARGKHSTHGRCRDSSIIIERIVAIVTWTWLFIQVFPFTSCVTLGCSLTLSEPLRCLMEAAILPT